MTYAIRQACLVLRKYRCLFFMRVDDVAVERTFRAMTKLSGGAYAPFDLASPDQLKRLCRRCSLCNWWTTQHSAALPTSNRAKAIDPQLPKT